MGSKSGPVGPDNRAEVSALHKKLEKLTASLKMQEEATKKAEIVAEQAMKEAGKKDDSKYKAKIRTKIAASAAATTPGIRAEEVQEGAMLEILTKACQAMKSEYLMQVREAIADEDLAAMMVHLLIIWMQDTKKHGNQANEWFRQVSMYVGSAMGRSTYTEIITELGKRVGEFMSRVRPWRETTRELNEMRFDPNGAKSPREWVMDYLRLARLKARGLQAEMRIDLLRPLADAGAVEVDLGTFNDALASDVLWSAMIHSNADYRVLSPSDEKHLAWLEQCWAAWRSALKPTTSRKQPAAAAVSFQQQNEEDDDEDTAFTAAAAIDGYPIKRQGSGPPRFKSAAKKPAAAVGQGGGDVVRQQQWEKDKAEGRCFKCHQVGHKSLGCTGKLKSEELLEENRSLKKELEELRKSKN
jgi:hypothetical protein